MSNLWVEIKDRYPLKTLAAEYGLDVSHQKTICPKCNHKTPTLYIGESFFKCHAAGCEFKGDLFNLTAELADLDRWGALKLLAGRLGLSVQQTPEDLRREERSEVFRRFAEQYASLPDAAREYLHGRGLIDTFIERKLIGFVPLDAASEKSIMLREAGLPGILRGRILVPFWHGPQVVYFTGRSLTDDVGPKYMNIKGEKDLLGTMRGPDLLITEGIFDQLLAEQAGYNVIAIAGSSRDIRITPGIRHVTLIMDGDIQGRKYIERYGPSISEQGADVDVVLLTEGTDLADYIHAGGRIEDLPRISLTDYFYAKVVGAPKDKAIKGEYYRVVASLDPVGRELALKRLEKPLAVGLRVIKADFQDYVQEEVESEFSTDDGFKFKIPDGYFMNGRGIMYSKANITFESVIIDSFGIDKKTREEYFHLRYGTGKTQIVPRFALSKSQELLEYSRFGLPVNSANAIGLIRFFDAWNAANRDRYGTFSVVSQLGWDGDQFIFPDRIIPAGKDDNIHYVDRTIGKEVYTRKGTMQGWVDTLKALGTYPNAVVARFLLYAAFASIVLEPLNRRPFIIHLHGDTSIGKTSALRIPASVYGNPVEGKAMIKWKNTETFLVRYMEKLKNIPLIIDESSSETRTIFESIIYQMESGISKGKALRNDPTGTAALRTFRLGVFSSGEPPVLNERFLSGAQVRVMEFHGSPFGGDLERAQIDALNLGLAKNYGWGADAFIENFLRMRDVIDWGQSPITSDEGLTSTETRVKQQLDLIWICGTIIEEIFHFGFDPAADVIKIFNLLRTQMYDSVRMYEKIMQAVNDHYTENQHSFPEVMRDGITGPNEAKIIAHCKTFGFVFENGHDLGILKTHFKEFITEHLGHQNSGDYAINILKENKKISGSREQRRVNGKINSFVYFPNFFQDDQDEGF